MKSILILAPMPEEANAITNALRKFNVNRIYADVIQCGIGKVNATMTTTNILAHNPKTYDHIFLIGYAAGTVEYPIGSIVIPKCGKCFDMLHPESVDELFKPMTSTYNLADIGINNDAICCTTDSFITSKEIETFKLPRNNAIYEMEASAIAKVAEAYKIPFNVIKIISDSPNNDNGVDFNEFVKSNTCFDKIAKIIKHLQTSDKNLAERIINTCPICKDFPKPGVNFIDIFPLLNDPILYYKILNKIKEFSYTNIAMVESRAFCFAPALNSMSQANYNFIPIRKAGKLPNAKYSFESTKEYGSDTLELQEYGDIKQITIFDDILATGGTAEAIAKFFKSKNPDIEINFVFIIEISDLNGRKKLEKYGDIESLASI